MSEGCPIPCWDNGVQYRCGKGGYSGECPTHGKWHVGRVPLAAVISDQLQVSTSEARRLIWQGGVKLDGHPVVDVDPPAELVSGKTLKVGKGREVRVP